jgi:hypothetical protein
MITLLMPPIGNRFLQLEGKAFALLVENQTARAIVAYDANTSVSRSSSQNMKKINKLTVCIASVETFSPSTYHLTSSDRMLKANGYTHLHALLLPYALRVKADNIDGSTVITTS